MQHTIDVREMSLEHIDDVMVVEHLSFSIPWSKEAFIEEISNNQFAHYISAFVGAKVVGYAGMWKVCDEGHITNVAVHPDYRGTGIGSCLIEKLLDMAKSYKIVSMTLEVRKSNLVAQALYSKYGFEVGGFRRRYYADNGEDALIMWKNGI
ncbi:MAG: ribosomal-protein-alanine acetyltransferase [Clostridiales bacterium]|jgi:ribosomal-protein-alanine N-acetyltransferase|nr:ribosomal-protein-alanine acetyltransferase [Clostridiales bacterium]